jgi:hypothetical protein
LNPVDGLKDVVQGMAEFTCHSEDAHGRLFDLRPQPGMQAIPRGYVDRDVQFILQKELNAHKIEGIETALGIIADEKVKIAPLAGFISNR